MEVAQALAELLELSGQVERAVVLDADGSLLGAAPDEPAGGEVLARAALELVTAASGLRSAAEVTRAEVELAEGGLFVIREEGRTIAATTGPRPTAGLVAYDLRTCLARIEPGKPKRRRSPRRSKAAE